MKDTFYAIIHHFIHRKAFSPDDCPNHIAVLHRIIHFYYVKLVEGEPTSEGMYCTS